MKLAGLWRICVSLLLTLGGLLVVFGLSRIETQAADNPPPYVQAPNFVHITTITTLTLPTRFTLLTPAFEVIATDSPFTLTIDAHGFSEEAQLAYRPNVTAPWQRLKLAMDTQSVLWLVSNAPRGTYAVVSVTAATSLPADAVIVDDLSTNFQRYGKTTNWHAVTGTKYYLEHAYWTYNTDTAIENYGIWTPTANLSGVYAVQVFVPGNYADTERAVYQIQHDGQTAVYTVSQNSYWAEWVNLGVYTFTPATASYVKLTDVTYEDVYTNWVAFDAVAFVPQIKHIYLPLVMREWPPSPQKVWSGMHLGNRFSGWEDYMLAPFDPTRNGIWPAVVVVLSNQVYNIQRSGSDCHIESVEIRDAIIYDFLQRAATLGNVQVIVRIYPSPGNFEEAANPDWQNPITRPNGRTLITAPGEYPGDLTQCNNENNFRSIDDIGNEIIEIKQYSPWIWGFEPANEPNIEWYWNDAKPPEERPVPSYFDRAAWQDMDRYFANLYDYIQDNSDGLAIRVLTPPMSQSALAETNEINSDDCHAYDFSGYEQMPLTFNSPDPKSWGYSWHNYWRWGRESWDTCPNGQHVSMWFPSFMKYNITMWYRPAIITEADLFSPQKGGTWITNKDYSPGSTALSINDFLKNEHDVWEMSSIAVWLLNDQTDPAIDPTTALEHQWHQAYTPTLGFRQWFTDWWFNPEN